MGITIFPKGFLDRFDALNLSLQKIADTKDVADVSSSPGRKVLMAGDNNAGFFGFVKADDFITGAALATELGISSGTSINSDTPWIKYIWKGKVCFTPLKPIRHSIAWDAIYNAGAVYASGDEGTLPPKGRLGVGLSIDSIDNSVNTTTQHFLEGTDNSDTVGAIGDTLVLKGWSNPENNGDFVIDTITNTKIVLSGGSLVTEFSGKLSGFYNSANAVTQNTTVTIGGLGYSARLFRGASNDPTDTYDDADRGSIGPDNEWNSIILPLHEKAKLQDWAYPDYAGTTEDFGVYLSDEDLVTDSLLGLGSYTWCQESRDATSWRRVARGYMSASYLAVIHSWVVSSARGLRPVLELPQTATL